MSEAKVENTFKKNKNSLIKFFGRKGLLGSDIEKLGKKLFGTKWVGVHSVDNYPLTKSGYGIINTDTSNGPGIHWIAIYSTPKKIYVYDSFARKSSSVLKLFHDKALEKQFRVINSDLSDKEQRSNEKICGQLSLAWLMTVKEKGIMKALKI